MKTIALKTTSEKVLNGSQDVELKISTTDLIKTACSNKAQEGFTASDMMDRIRILDKLKAAEGKDELELEDADFANLGSYVRNTKWGVVSKEIVEFVNQF